MPLLSMPLLRAELLLLLAAWAVAPGVWAAGSASASTAPLRPLADAALQQALQGLWCNREPGAVACWAHDLFSPDGQFASCGQAEGDARPFSGRGRYTVEGQHMCYRVEAASANFWLPVGARYCTRIVTIGPQQHRYQDLDSGAEFTLWREAGPPPHCLAGG